MAVHKVPQDVEAEDKFVGPLTFKQFLFTGGAAIFGYLIFLTLTKGIWPISIIFAFPFTVFGFLAFPWSKEQPTELWLAARIRFLIKPRKRIWDQSGLKDLVSVTVPKRLAHNYTDGLNPSQVQNRLSALATMVDSRGWAVKNYTATDDSSDRLTGGNISVAPAVAVLDSPDDVMDEQRSVIAQQFDTKIQASEQKHKSETMRLIKEARENTQYAAQDTRSQPLAPKPQTTQRAIESSGAGKQEDFWFMNSTPEAVSDPSLAVFQSSSVIQPGANDPTPQPQSASQPTNLNDNDLDEAGLLAKAHEKQRVDAMQLHSSHEKTLSPLGDVSTNTPVTEPPTVTDNPAVTTVSDPDILNLARNNDLNLETLSRTAKRDRDLPTDEVVISLH